MTEEKITQYKCDYCGEIFGTKYDCRIHEKYGHKCPHCDHAYYVYGCEFNCERENEGKRCSFKKKKDET